MHKQKENHRRRFIKSASLLAATAPAAGGVLANTFKPRTPVTMISAYPPGGLGDATARILAKGLAQRWGVPVPVENRTGASGMIAAASVAKGPADGSQLLCMLPEALSVAAALKAPLNFNAASDLQPVALSVISGCLLAVNTKGRFKSYGDMVAFARENPGRLNFGVQGTGSAFHLSVEHWALKEGIKVTAVPYKGGAPALTDLLGGQIDAMFLATSLGLPYFQGGQLLPLAVANLERLKDLPEVPTLHELGVKDFEVPITLGVLVSTATDRSIVQALNEDLRAVMHQPEAREWMTKNVVITTDLSADAFKARMKQEVSTFADVAERAGIKLS